MSWHFVSRLLRLSIALACAITSSVYAQVLRFDFDEYSIQDGLSQNMVWAITQDKKGFLWFGTQDGLNRFDGYEFKVFRHHENNPNTVASNSIHVLFVDDDGSIWIGTDNGLCRFFPQHETFEQFPVDFNDDTKLNGTYISSITKRPDGSMWLSYIGSGVDVMYPGEKDIFHYTIHRDDEYRLTNDMISAIQFMPDGSVLLGSYEGIQAIDHRGVVMTEDELLKKYPWKNEIHKSIKKMLLSHHGKILWIGTEVSGLYKVDLTTHTVTNFNTSNSGLESNDILALYKDSKETIWMGSDALYWFDEKRNTLQWYNQNGMYIKNHTHCVYEDKDKNLWMGTSRLGVRKLNPPDSHVHHFHSNQGEGSIKSDEVLAFQQDNQGHLWVALGGSGLARMNMHENSFTDSPVNNKLNSLTIKTIRNDNEGYFWMGGWDAGLIRYHPKNQTLEQYHPKNGTFKSHHIWDIQIDTKGNLWLGTLRNGLGYFSPKTKEVKYYQYQLEDSTSLTNNDVLSLHLDSRNVLWVGTAYGLSILYPETEKFVNLHTFQTKGSPLTNNVILTIAEDNSGRIWLGTKGNGIVVMNISEGKPVVEKIIKETDGLPSGSISGIQYDHRHNAWVSTTNGLVKINSSTFAVEPIPQCIALRGTEFIPQSSLRLPDDHLLFGSTAGFYLFHPDSLKPEPEIDDIVFTSLKVVNEEIIPGAVFQNRKILDQSITEIETLSLTYEDYAFTLTFSPLRFKGQDDLHYAFFLENLDKNWQYTTSDKRFVHYTNLEPGKYRLHIKASYDGIHWPEKTKTLTIVITPPWWSTWWSRAAGMVIIGTLALTVHKTRIRFLEKQSRKLERLVEQRTSELHHSNEEIQALLKEVAEQKENIELKNRELQCSNDEIHSQHDRLIEKSNELEKAQYELQKINVSLEDLAAKRTQTLNETLMELETFLYRASHDLQGPVSTLYGIIGLAKLEMQTNPTFDHSTYYNMIESSLVKLETTLKKLMHKHSIQKTHVQPEPLRSYAILCIAQKVISEIQEFRAEDFEMHIDENINFRTDKAFLAIILYCLLENAFVYSRTSRNKKVSLFVHQNASSLVIEITDHGVGINHELQDKIFTMFYRGSELSSGNGLGLYLVKNTLDKLNGTIKLQTEENCFSKFTVNLPVSGNNKESHLQETVA